MNNKNVSNNNKIIDIPHRTVLFQSSQSKGTYYGNQIATKYIYLGIYI